MKIELTELQAKKIIEAVKEKFQNTKDAIWLGLQHNLESQVFWREQKRPYVLAWMEKEFEPIKGVIDPFDRIYDARPVFMEYLKLKKDIHTVDENIGGIKVRIKQCSPMHQTKSYHVIYSILTA